MWVQPSKRDSCYPSKISHKTVTQNFTPALSEPDGQAVHNLFLVQSLLDLGSPHRLEPLQTHYILEVDVEPLGLLGQVAFLLALGKP